MKGTLHWVSSNHCFDIETRIYNHLFAKEFPEIDLDGGDFKENLNQDSLEVRKVCKAELSLKNAKPEERFQFLRQGYFCLDGTEPGSGKPVFNRTVSLRDTWAKIQRNTK